MLQSSQVKMARVVFARKEPKLASLAKTTRPKDLPALVRIPKDHHAVDVRLRPPKRSRSLLDSGAHYVLLMHVDSRAGHTRVHDGVPADRQERRLGG